MKKILVPIDGSKYSKLAMEKAKKIADAFDSSIVLIHVNDFYSHMFNYNTEVEETFKQKFDQMSKDILDEGRLYFSDMEDRLEVIEMEGNVANKIIDYVNNNNDIDLVVIGSHGRSGIQGFLVGSVAHRVALHVDKSVFIVR